MSRQKKAVTAPEKPVAVLSDPGPLPELAWLPIDKLRINSRYQRTLDSKGSQRAIAKIVAEFSWRLFGTIMATPDGAGGWWVIDGQHRMAAAGIRCITHIPAYVVAASTVAEQAAAFVKSNKNRMSVNGFQLHHARLAAGDADAMQLDLLCDIAGLVIPRNPLPQDRLKEGNTLAIGTLAGLIKQETMVTAILVASAVSIAYRTRPAYMRAPMFRAVSELLRGIDEKAKKAESLRVAEFLKKHDPGELISLAFRHRADTRCTEARALAAVIRRAMGSSPASEPIRIGPSRTMTRALTPAMMSFDEKFHRMTGAGTPVARIASALGITAAEVEARQAAMRAA